MKSRPVIVALACLLIPLLQAHGGVPVPEDQVVEIRVTNDPTVSFRILFNAGSQNDPAGKEGLAAITASMISDGATTKNSYEQILDKLYPLAAGYSATVSVEQTVITGRVHKDNLAAYYGLLTDALLHPAFKQDDLDRIKSQTLNYLENILRYSSDEELGKAVLYSTIFAGSGYGHPTEGLVGSVRSITLDDVRAFYTKYYTSGNLVIGLGGGYAPTLLESLRKDLAQLPGDKPTPAPKPRVPSLNGTSVTIVEKKAPATAISMGFPIDVLRGDPDWYPLAVATSWLGEHRNSSSHLYQVIREERGLNYGDYAYIENFPHSGSYTMPLQNVARRQQIFEIWIRPVPNEARLFALRAALREFNHLVDHGMTQSDFELTRGFLSKYILHYAETTMERLGYALDDRFYGINGDHLQRYQAALKSMTVQDVNTAIKKHWQTRNMAIAIVSGDAEALKDALTKNTPSPISYASPKPAALLEEDKEIAAYPLSVAPGNVRIAPVTDCFK